MTPRVLVADDLTVFRAAVSRVISRAGTLDVLEAGSLSEIERVLETASVDIALVDVALPPGGVRDVISVLRSAGDTPVIVWGAAAEPDTIVACVRAGASGFLLKDISGEALIRCLHGALRGEAAMSREVMATMIRALHGLEERFEIREQLASLSQRERQVLAYLAGGAKNSQIADELAISPFTVKRHVQNILQKLEVPTRAQAAAIYRLAVEKLDASRSARRPYPALLAGGSQL